MLLNSADDEEFMNLYRRLGKKGKKRIAMLLLAANQFFCEILDDLPVGGGGPAIEFEYLVIGQVDFHVAKLDLHPDHLKDKSGWNSQHPS